MECLDNLRFLEDIKSKLAYFLFFCFFFPVNYCTNATILIAAAIILFQIYWIPYNETRLKLKRFTNIVHNYILTAVNT